MKETKVTLAQDSAGKVEEYNQDALYLVDFTKIESVNDLVLIFAAMGISFHAKHPHFEAVKKFVDLSKPISPQSLGGVPQPQETKITLPKLKKVE